MSKLTLEIDSRQVETLVESLPIREKLNLVRRLNSETWQIRFRNLLSGIDQRMRNKRTLSDQRIVQIVKKARKRNYAQSHH